MAEGKLLRFKQDVKSPFVEFALGNYKRRFDAREHLLEWRCVSGGDLRDHYGNKEKREAEFVPESARGDHMAAFKSTSYKGNCDGQAHSDDWGVRYQGGGVWVFEGANHPAGVSGAEREYGGDGDDEIICG